MNQYHSIYTPDSFPCFNGVAEYILSFFTVVEPLDAALQQLSHVCVCVFLSFLPLFCWKHRVYLFACLLKKNKTQQLTTQVCISSL